MSCSVFIMTDSNSGILPLEGEKLGIGVVPMPFFVDGQIYYEGLSLFREDFFDRLSGGASISTSQPSPALLTEYWDKALKTCDQLLYIPMSSALSGSAATARALSRDYEGRVFVVDNRRISCTQKQAVLEAAELAKKGHDALWIQSILEARALDASIYLSPENLTYLLRGGRVTPAAAAISTVLNIRPVLTIQGGRLDACGRARGQKAARKALLDAAERDCDIRFSDRPVLIRGAYSCSEEKAREWQAELSSRFLGHEITLDPLPLSICCHTGPGTIAVVCLPLPAEN